MKYAVIKLSGQQFRVSEGDTIEVNRLSSLDPKVLLFVDGDKVLVGRPYVEGISVRAKIKENILGEKITIRRFKAKSRYHKTRGFRPSLSLVEIVSIGEGLQVNHVEAPQAKKRGRPRKVQ